MLFACPAYTVSTPLCAPLHGPSPSRIYVGRENQLQVHIPRIEGAGVATTIDGRLDEAVWYEAALLTGFSQFSPQDGIPAADSTHVLVWYSPAALHIGVRAFEVHGGGAAVDATLDRKSVV